MIADQHGKRWGQQVSGVVAASLIANHYQGSDTHSSNSFEKNQE